MTHPIIITGASRGLGKALAVKLSREFHIIAVARTTGGLEDLDDLIKSQGGSSTLAPIDITDTNAVRYLCKMIYDRWGKLYLWAHCAVHAAPLSPAHVINNRDWEKSVNINITATRTLIINFTPLLDKTSTVLFFEDTCSGRKFFGSYGATKAGQISLANSWKKETVNIGPSIKIFNPAPMPTATRARFFPGEDRKKLSNCDIEADHIVNSLSLPKNLSRHN